MKKKIDQYKKSIMKEEEECEIDMFPVETGGTANEQVKCMVFDEDAKLIITAGITESKQYGMFKNDFKNR